MNKSQFFINNTVTNTLLGIFDHVLRLITGAVIGILIARQYGASVFGTLSYAQSLSAIILPFIVLGTDLTIFKHYSSTSPNSNALLNKIVIIRALSYLSIMIFGAILYLKNNIEALILIIIFSNVIAIFQTHEKYFVAKKSTHLTIYSSIISTAIGITLKLYIITNQYNIIYIAWAILTENIIKSVCFYLFFNKSTKIQQENTKTGNEIKFIEIIKDSIPLFLSGLMISVYSRVDQLMINNILGAQELGYYSSAVKISELWFFLPIIISDHIFPKLVNNFNSDRIIFLSSITNTLKYFILVSIFIALVLSSFSLEIMSIVYGESYSKSARTLAILSFCGLFVSIGVIRTKILYLYKLKRIVFISTIFGAISNILLNFALIPILGIDGSALATLLSMAFVTVTPLYKMYKTDINLFRTFVLIKPKYLPQKKGAAL